MKETSFIDGFIYEWGIYVALFTVSIIATAIIIERLYYYNRKARAVSYYFIAHLKDQLGVGRYEEALALVKQNDGPAARVIEVGIQHKLNNSTHIQDEMQQAGNEQVTQLEKYLSGLATIATISPLLGILGTVLGMIKAFANYSAGSNKVEMMAGINVALYTTALGLVIAIPAYIFYNFLQQKMNERILEMEGVVNQVQKILSK